MAEKQHWFSVAQRDLRRRRLWLGRERNCKVFNSRDHEESLVKRCSGARHRSDHKRDVSHCQFAEAGRTCEAQV